MVAIVQTIHDKEPLVKAVAYIVIINVVKGTSQIETDFHISPESRPWIFPDFTNACLCNGMKKKHYKSQSTNIC